MKRFFIQGSLVKLQIVEMDLQHKPVMLKEVLSYFPSQPTEKTLLGIDCTAGGGGHLLALLENFPNLLMEAWDQDPDALPRIEKKISQKNLLSRVTLRQKKFSGEPGGDLLYDFILADLGVSSFQLEDMRRGFSFRSEHPVDMRMNPQGAFDFYEWVQSQGLSELERIFDVYGDEPRAKKLASEMLRFPRSSYLSVKKFSEEIARALGYSSPSLRHPATRALQALRIAVNHEVEELEALLRWSPFRLKKGGRLVILTFHSLEDRLVKQSFKTLEETESFVILTLKPLAPTPEECDANPRARSAKMRVLERKEQVEGPKTPGEN